jgi:hypothetical protein
LRLKILDQSLEYQTPFVAYGCYGSLGGPCSENVPWLAMSILRARILARI